MHGALLEEGVRSKLSAYLEHRALYSDTAYAQPHRLPDYTVYGTARTTEGSLDHFTAGTGRVVLGELFQETNKDNHWISTYKPIGSIRHVNPEYYYGSRDYWFTHGEAHNTPVDFRYLSSDFLRADDLMRRDFDIVSERRFEQLYNYYSDTVFSGIMAKQTTPEFVYAIRSMKATRVLATISVAPCEDFREDLYYDFFTRLYGELDLERSLARGKDGDVLAKGGRGLYLDNFQALDYASLHLNDKACNVETEALHSYITSFRG